MKKILLSIFTLFLIGIFSKSLAQGTGACALGFSNVVISINGDPESIGGTQCRIKFDISFDLSYNNGNVAVWLHSWLESQYVPSFDCTKSGAANPPTRTTLGLGVSDAGKSFFDIGLDNSAPRGANGIPVNVPILNTYPPDAGVILTTGINSPGLVVTKTNFGDPNIDRFDIKNVEVIINQSCATELKVKTDVWSGNSTGSNKAQCFVCATPSTFNNPAISGVITCAIPRTYSLNITTTSVVDQQISYKVYIDVNDNNTVEAGADIEVYNSDDSQPQPLNISTTNSHNLPNQGFLPYSSQVAYGDKNLLVLLTSPSLTNSRLQVITKNPDIECALLPVKLKSFTASRKQTNVELKWTTTLEQNNSGFELQRQSGAGGWQKIAFVNSKATDGNSVSDLHYSYTDANDSRGVSQYRLMQVDLDDNAKYSDIRSVQGIGQEARTIISPNPSANGRVNVTFQSASSKKDLQLTDMHGRMLKQWNAYSDNSLQITDLTPGIYQLRIVDRETGTQTVEKIMVVNR